MNSVSPTLLVLLFFGIPPLTLISQDAEITGNSVGGVRIGMTVAEAKRVLDSASFRRVSDGEGIPLVGVFIKGVSVFHFYAGEESSDAPIDDEAKIEFFEVWHRSFRTTEGLHVGMKVGDAEKKIGKLQQIFMSELESREFADFSAKTPGLQYRLTSPNGAAGIYPLGEMLTNQYDPEATIFSISVMGIDIMDAETIGGIGIDATEPEIYAAAGPDSFNDLEKGEDFVLEAIGEAVQTWTFPSSGLSVEMASSTIAGKKRAFSISLEGPSPLKTGRGIGIGSTKPEVLAAYEEVRNDDEGNAGFFEGQDVHIVGSVYGGLVFWFENDKVIRIFLGTSAE